MKKNLVIFLTIFCTAILPFNNINTFKEQNSKLLVIDKPIDAFNINFFYKTKC